MYKIIQKSPSNQHPNIKPNGPSNPQKYIQSYTIDYLKVLGKGNFSTVYSVNNKNGMRIPHPQSSVWLFVSSCCMAKFLIIF